MVIIKNSKHRNREKYPKKRSKTIKLIDSNLYATMRKTRHKSFVEENWHCESFSEERKPLSVAW